VRAPVQDLHASNLLTYLSLASAIAAIGVSGRPGALHLAAALLAASALLDTFDGRFARLFTRTPRQARAGHELDSLVDVVAFGVAPVVVLSAAAATGAGADGVTFWIAGFIYVLASVTRLGYFNVEDDANGFVGLPMPALALVCSTAMLWSPPAAVLSGVLVLCAAAMVAPVPIPRPRLVGLAAFALWAVILVLGHGARAAAG
jgi:CDP-diacylglycerol--serine O-phosphatidyltransferase